MRNHIHPLAEHPDIVELTVDWQLREFDPDGDRDRWLHARREEARRSSGVPCAWVAIAGDAPVGSVSLIASNMETRPELTPWLAALFVLPEHRGQGVGTALTRHCEAEAASLGFKRLFLYTDRALEFYQRLGWVGIDNDLYEGERVTIMARDLLA